MKFDLFHLSLIEPRSPLFARSLKREDWLREAFSKRFQFIHSGNELHWVPASDIGDLLFGRVDRQVKHEHHADPEQGGHEIASFEWQGAIVIIDPTHHVDGQKVAFETDRVVGATRSLLVSLLQAINSNLEAPYHIESKPIFDADDFWAFAREHENLVKRITFDFVVPNMWVTTSSLDEDLRDTGHTTGAQKVRTALISDDGVVADSEPVKIGVEYAARGGGSFSAKSLNGAVFSSTETQKKTSIPAAPVGQIEEYLKRFVGRILGREQSNSLDDTNRDGDGSPLD